MVFSQQKMFTHPTSDRLYEIARKSLPTVEPRLVSFAGLMAAFCRHIYSRADSPVRYTGDAYVHDWALIKKESSSGNVESEYTKDVEVWKYSSPKETVILIVNRGSVPKAQGGDMLKGRIFVKDDEDADKSIALKRELLSPRISGALRHAITAALEQACEHRVARNKMSPAPTILVFTGHSLGGMISMMQGEVFSNSVVYAFNPAVPYKSVWRRRCLHEGCLINVFRIKSDLVSIGASKLSGPSNIRVHHIASPKSPLHRRFLDAHSIATFLEPASLESLAAGAMETGACTSTECAVELPPCKSARTGTTCYTDEPRRWWELWQRRWRCMVLEETLVHRYQIAEDRAVQNELIKVLEGLRRGEFAPHEFDGSIRSLIEDTHVDDALVRWADQGLVKYRDGQWYDCGLASEIAGRMRPARVAV